MAWPGTARTVRGVMKILLRPFKLVTYKELAFLLLGLPMSIVAFTVIVTGLSIGLSLAIFIIGIPVLMGAVYANRAVAMVERYRAALVLGSPIAHAYRKPSRPGFFPLARTLATDPQTWRDAGWMIIGTVISFTFSIVAIVLWSITLSAVTFPLWAWALPDSSMQFEADIAPNSRLWDFLDHFGDLHQTATTTEWHGPHGAAGYVVVFLIGLVLLPLTVWLCAAMARGRGSARPAPPLAYRLRSPRRGADAHPRRLGRRPGVRASAHRARPP